MDMKRLGSFTNFTMVVVLLICMAIPVLAILTNLNLKNSSPSQIVGLMIEGEPRLRKLIVQDRPVHNSESIKEWIKVAANHFLNYEASDYKTMITDGRKFMTNRFYEGFYMKHALRINQNIKNGYYISSSVVIEEPKLIAKAVVNGQDYYKYYMKTSTVYKAESKNAYKDHELFVTVKMENPEDNLRGLAIDELIIK